MPWTYDQSSGDLTHNGTYVGRGYSGAGTDSTTGRNNPQMENVRDHGPIPQGQWRIGPAYRHPRTGPISMNLTPIGHNAHGRTEFMIHGDNAANDASQGCIILGPAIRQQIADSGDNELNVVP